MKYFILAALLSVAVASPIFGLQSYQAPGPTKADQPQNTLVQAPGPSTADQPGQPIGQAAGPSESATSNANARRQRQVNIKALHYGAGVGTAPYYGVPGTDVNGVHNYGRHYGHGYGHHDAYNGGHGYGGYNNGHHGGYNKH